MRNKENFPKTKSIWVLFDLDNGHEPSKHYCWWFNTRKNARDHKKFQKKQKFASKLTAPYKFTIDKFSI